MLCGSLDGRGVWGRTDTCICMAESLWCPSETITILSIGYTPMQNKQFKRIGIQWPCGFWPREPKLGERGERDDSWTAAAARPPLTARSPHNLTGRAASARRPIHKTGLLTRRRATTCPRRMPLLPHPLTYFANTFSSPLKQRQRYISKKRPQKLLGPCSYSN